MTISDIYIKIDSQEKSWSKSFITPKDILEIGKRQEPYNVYIIFRIQNGKKEEIWDGIEQDLHKEIEVKNGDEFTICYKSQELKIHYTVNGEDQEILATNNKQTVAQILEKAEFIPVEKFKLFNAKTNEDYKDLNQTISIKAGDEFLALSSGPTPVA